MFGFLKQDEMPYISAVILCAGSSSRMEDSINKQFIMINDIPVVMHSILAFEGCEEIKEIIIVTKEDMIPDLNAMVKEYACNKVKTIIQGGMSRTESSKIGVEQTSEKTEYVLIHDGARPLVSQSLISLVSGAVVKHGAVAPSTPIFETVKRVNKDGMVVETVNRDSLRTVQTPQGFLKRLYLLAVYQNNSMNADLFDDCQLIESIGESVTLVEGERDNIKITTLEDVDRVKSIFIRRYEKDM